MTTARAEGGYALVAVLWASILLSVIAAALVSQSRFAARIESNEWRRLEIETFADAATDAAIQALLNAREAPPVILSGATLSGDWQGEPFDFSFEDETGKIDLNEVDAPILTNAFRSAGLAASDAEGLARAVIDWRTLPKSSTAPDGPVAFRRFQSVSEIMLIPDISADLFQKLRQTFSVHSQSSVTNPELASEATLKALFPDDQAKVGAMLAQRKLAADIAIREFLRPSDSGYSALRGRAVAVTVSFRVAGRNCTFQTVIRITGLAQRPFWVLSKERLE